MRILKKSLDDKSFNFEPINKCTRGNSNYMIGGSSKSGYSWHYENRNGQMHHPKETM